MANRPIFVPRVSGLILVKEETTEFKWHAGMAASQKQKSIDELHLAAKKSLGLVRVLEVSTKSRESLGRALSAFNLKLNLNCCISIPVEVSYQAAKVFENGGPYVDLLECDSYTAKTDERLKSSGALRNFEYQEVAWPLEPPTSFYDWLYIKALVSNPALAAEVTSWEAFTDIEFNPKKSLNCQARSVALFCSLVERQMLEVAMRSPEGFRNMLPGGSSSSEQSQLF